MTPAVDSLDALLLAYVDGEMDTAARVLFESRVNADPGLRAEVDSALAVKQLLRADAQFRTDAKLDVVPAQLLEAIVRAEVLARSETVKRAIVSNTAPVASRLVNRVSTWFLGGGVLAAAAVVVLYVGPHAATEAPSSAQPQAPTAALDSTSPQGAAGAREADGAVASALGGALGGASANGFADDPATRDALAQAHAGKAASAEVAERVGRADAVKDSKADLSERRMPPPPPSAASAGAGSDSAGGVGRAASEGVTLAKEKLSAPISSARDEEVALSADKMAQTRQQPEAKRKNGSSDDVQLPASPAMVASSPKVSTPTASSASLDDAPKPSSQTDAKRRLADARKKAPSKAAAADSPTQMRDLELANLAFSTGLNELKNKRYAEALDAFETAERGDHKKTLGLSPVVGQMRVYTALKRYADVARLGGRLIYADIHKPDIIDGLRMGADAADRTNDALMAEQLWTRLLESPKDRPQAQRALQRGQRPMREAARKAAAPIDTAPTDAAQQPAEPAK